MKPFTFKEALLACGGEFFGQKNVLEQPVLDVVIDNRKVIPGALFVPIRGERFDGHDFISAAYDAGAAVCVSERPLAGGAPHILVGSSLDALRSIAAYYRSLFSIPVYGVTGSCGKTTVKEMIALVLAQACNVHKTQGNFNNQTGVPQTLFKMDDNCGAAVIEMGTNNFGEIDELAKMARPKFCFITNIGDAHIENFGSRAGTLKAKCEMLAHMQPGGAAFVNGDDELLRRLRDPKSNVYTYGFSEGCDIRGIDFCNSGLAGSDVTVKTCSGTFKMHVPSPGKHMAQNALAAVCAGLTQNVPHNKIAAAIASFSPVGSRMKIIETGRFTLLSDAYNANPASVKAALDILKTVPNRKIAVLGDMAELGAMTEKSHREIVEYATLCGIDLILCAGAHYGFVSDRNGTRRFAGKKELLMELPTLLKDGDAILVKGSHSAGLEEVAEFIAERI